MKSIQILALSSSRTGRSGYLETALPLIKELLGEKPLKIAFIPFASVDGYQEYYLKVSSALKNLPYSIFLVNPKDGHSVINECDCIMTGGGNTFKLLHDLYENNLLDLLGKKIASGVPYIGWSAGSNILGPAINTTNDMPIIQPPSFTALGALPFLINPHYLNEEKDGFNGETRDMRLEELVKLNPSAEICALPEGSALLLQDGALVYRADQPGFLFRNTGGAMYKQEISPGSNLREYLI